MKIKYWISIFTALLTVFQLASATGVYATGANAIQSNIENRQAAQAAQGFIIDHTSTKITAIPQAWIQKAKTDLHIFYGHTSHGSQLVTGMEGLVGFANNGGLGLDLPDNIFAGLDIHEDGPDAGYYPTWVNTTRSYLGAVDPATGRGKSHPNTNVVIWSWCGQLSGLTASEVTNEYLQPMSQLEADYPGIKFVYMTGHSDGTGLTGDLHKNNQQIRQYTIQNHKILYDFYDIELYDPDGKYFGDKRASDDCRYDSDGNGSLDSNWATQWTSKHTINKDYYNCECQHSEALNCNQKAYAAWWLWARLAGWSGPGVTQKTASVNTATFGQEITYTINLQNLNIAANTGVKVTDTIPAGLAYVPGSLTATSGLKNDSGAPTLTWSGTLGPTSIVTITYRATVTTHTTQAITNTAVISATDMPTIRSSAVVLIDPLQEFLPLLKK